MEKLTFTFEIPEDSHFNLPGQITGSFVATKHITDDLTWYHGLFEIETPEWSEEWPHLSESSELIDTLVSLLNTSGCHAVAGDGFKYTDTQPIIQQVLFDLDANTWSDINQLTPYTTQILYDKSTVDTED